MATELKEVVVYPDPIHLKEFPETLANRALHGVARLGSGFGIRGSKNRSRLKAVAIDFSVRSLGKRGHYHDSRWNGIVRQPIAQPPLQV
jgi:hypothetical protein